MRSRKRKMITNTVKAKYRRKFSIGKDFSIIILQFRLLQL